MSIVFGAGRGGRTPMTLRSADFESAASASSTIPAHLVNRLSTYLYINFCISASCIQTMVASSVTASSYGEISFSTAP